MSEYGEYVVETRKERYVQIRLRLLMIKSLLNETLEFIRTDIEKEQIDELEKTLNQVYTWFFEHDY